jgi:tetratricopeptide (TPR) repeat protein
LADRARDIESRVLLDAKRLDEALTLARRLAARPNARAGDYARLGDTLGEMKRYAEAADAYGRALAMSAGFPPDQVWPLHYLRASMFERAGRWPESRAEAEAGLKLAPDQPVLLNFLGYTKLERGEDLDAAEAMIRKASALDPDNASITDSLGWALFKRGRVHEAIKTLQAAAASDPDQAEINEHLGDALYMAGRRIEARFAWNAAMVVAEDEIARRVKAKLEWGLTPANAAP